MFKTHLIYLMVLFFPFAAITQGCNSVKTYAFARPFIPGNAIAEDQPGGRLKDRIFFHYVYVESTCNQPPLVPIAWINEKSYSTRVSAVAGNTANIGVPEGGDVAVVVKASGKNRLYLIEFLEEPVQHKLPAAYLKQNAANKIWLQLSVNGKSKILQTPSWQMLQPQVVY